jgi:hypothetical protein
MIFFHYIITIPQKTFQNPQESWTSFCKKVRKKALFQTLLYYKAQKPVVFATNPHKRALATAWLRRNPPS